MRVAIKASFGGIEFWAESSSCSSSRRIIEHGAFGRTGAETEDTGAPARRDMLTLRATYDDYKKFYQLAHQAKVRLFVHPVHGSWMARANITQESIEPGSVGVVKFHVEFIEHSTATLATQETKDTHRAIKNEIDSIADDIEETIDTTDVSVSDAYEDYQESFTTYTDTVESYDAGTREDVDIKRALADLREKSNSVVSAMDEVEDYIENQESVVGSIYRLAAKANELANALEYNAFSDWQMRVESWGDAYSLARDFYGDLTVAEIILKKNRLVDLLAIPPGTVLRMPYIGALDV